MKTRQISKLIALSLCIISGISCKDSKVDKQGEKQEVSVTKSEDMPVKTLQFKEPHNQLLFEHYIHLKTALVNSNAIEAQSAAKMLLNSTDNKDLLNAASRISNTEDIEEQRVAFVDVGTSVEAILENSISQGEIYKQFCPMAFNNTGGYWLSKVETIENPYFGSKMLNCGKVVEVIRQ